MKLTQEVINQFEIERIDYGVKVALQNFVWTIASDLMKSIGVKDIETTYHAE